MDKSTQFGGHGDYTLDYDKPIEFGIDDIISNEHHDKVLMKLILIAFVTKYLEKRGYENRLFSPNKGVKY